MARRSTGTADRDWDWHSAADDTPEELRRAARRRGRRGRRGRCATPLADGGLDRLVGQARRHGEHFNLRWILVHLVEEYARHNGHADLIRESIDGQTGD